VTAAGRKYFEPLRVRVRGGTAHCAATTCDLQNYVTPIALYTTARSIVLDEISNRRHAATDHGTCDHLIPEIRLLTVFTEIPPVIYVSSASHYRRAIAAAIILHEGQDAAWRDPRGRQAVRAELQRCVDTLVYLAPAACD